MIVKTAIVAHVALLRKRAAIQAAQGIQDPMQQEQAMIDQQLKERETAANRAAQEAQTQLKEAQAAAKIQKAHAQMGQIEAQTAAELQPEQPEQQPIMGGTGAQTMPAPSPGAGGLGSAQTMPLRGGATPGVSTMPATQWMNSTPGR
jgi:hypothetical protein